MLRNTGSANHTIGRSTLGARMPNNMLSPPPWGLAPSPIWEILDPPLHDTTISQPAQGTFENADTVHEIQMSHLPPDVGGAEDGEAVHEIRSV